MKKAILLTALSTFLILGTGCQLQTQAQPQPKKEQVTYVPPAVEELQVQPIPKTIKQEKSKTVVNTKSIQAETSLYKGTWFDIEYPQNFTAIPTSLYGDNPKIETDEVYFTSPYGEVEFFVYSPLWSGNPKNYLDISANEELVSEKTNQTDDQIVRWATLKAKDGSYYRSYVSIKDQVGTGSELHHVFGIKYKDNVSYEKHKQAYIAFKESLQQYAD